MHCCLCSELIRRYKEKGQESARWQEQLRESRSREASLQQGLVGLKAEMQALVEENSCLRQALRDSQLQREAAEARATNAEVRLVACW